MGSNSLTLTVLQLGPVMTDTEWLEELLGFSVTGSPKPCDIGHSSPYGGSLTDFFVELMELDSTSKLHRMNLILAFLHSAAALETP